MHDGLEPSELIASSPKQGTFCQADHVALRNRLHAPAVLPVQPWDTRNQVDPVYIHFCTFSVSCFVAKINLKMLKEKTHLGTNSVERTSSKGLLRMLTLSTENTDFSRRKSLLRQHWQMATVQTLQQQLLEERVWKTGACHHK